MLSPRNLVLCLAAAAVLAVLPSCGEYIDKFAPTPPPPVSRGHPRGKFLSYDERNHSVVLLLIAGDTASDNAFNFDGYSAGGMTVSVPSGWSVTVQCANRGTVPHSCAIVPATGGVAPAFPGASTPHPEIGLAPGASTAFDFVPRSPGSYRIECLVPGHEEAGMWDSFEVTPGGLPSISFAPQ